MIAAKREGSDFRATDERMVVVNTYEAEQMRRCLVPGTYRIKRTDGTYWLFVIKPMPGSEGSDSRDGEK